VLKIIIIRIPAFAILAAIALLYCLALHETFLMAIYLLRIFTFLHKSTQ